MTTVTRTYVFADPTDASRFNLFVCSMKYVHQSVKRGCIVEVTFNGAHPTYDADYCMDVSLDAYLHRMAQRHDGKCELDGSTMSLPNAGEYHTNPCFEEHVGPARNVDGTLRDKPLSCGDDSALDAATFQQQYTQAPPAVATIPNRYGHYAGDSGMMVDGTGKWECLGRDTYAVEGGDYTDSWPAFLLAADTLAVVVLRSGVKPCPRGMRVEDWDWEDEGHVNDIVEFTII